jgi:hypothetical protein
MRCMRRDCKNDAIVTPAMRCMDYLGGNVMWALGVPLCEPHTKDAVVHEIMTGPAYAQLCGMIRKEGYIPPDKNEPFDFIPLSKFSVTQQAAIATAAGVA